MIPLNTYTTMVDQTNDVDDLLELIEDIKKQRNDLRRKYYENRENILKKLDINSIDISSLIKSYSQNQQPNTNIYSKIEEWSKQDGVVELQANTKSFENTMNDYKKLIQYASKKCSGLIWSNSNDDKT